MQADIKAWAWRTPLGNDTDTVIARLLAGQRAARPNARFDAASYACTLAGDITGEPDMVRHRRFLRRMGMFAVEVAIEAMARAGLSGGDRVGLFFGYGGLRAHWNDMMPAFEHQRSDGDDSWNKGLSLLHPFWMLQHLSNNAHALAAQELGARGEGATYGGANAGAQALAAAIRSLAAGAVDAALVVGYDSLIEPETLVELGQRGALTRGGLPALLAPYDSAACGFVPAEAAAAMVLQRPGEGGATLARVQALDAADGGHGEVGTATLAHLIGQHGQRGDVVDGCGLANPRFDAAERSAAAHVVGDDAPLCCIMAAMGQTGAASSIVQSIALTELLRRGLLAPIAGLQSAAPGPLSPVLAAQSMTNRSAICLSTGAPGLAGIVRVCLA